MWTYAGYDGLGSARQLYDAAGAAGTGITWATNYDPYGTPFEQVMDTTSALGFTGEFADPSGLLYLRARYYQPDIGRFFQLDQVEGMLMSPGTWNRYQYGASNPIQFVDPSGFGPLDPARDYGAPLPPVADPFTGFWMELGQILGEALGYGLQNAVIAAVAKEPLPSPLPNVCPINTDTDTDDDERPIVLDLGPQINLPEIAALLAYRPNHKIVAIEQDLGIFPALNAWLSRGPEAIARNVLSNTGLNIDPEAIDLDRLEIIAGDYSDPNVLDGRKADEMFVIYPPAHSEENIAAAAEHHLKHGGAVYVVTENTEYWRRIYTTLEDAGVDFDLSQTRSPQRTPGIGGVDSLDIAMGNNGPGIPFYSGYSNAIVYDMYGHKR